MHPHTAPLGPGALLVAEITSGGVGGALWHSIATVPPWLGGALSALLAGALLRIGDPILRALALHEVATSGREQADELAEVKEAVRAATSTLGERLAKLEAAVAPRDGKGGA